ncbi:PREDICTED: (R,S)-reticuline 7-O-methyltransferase-like isoform X2 [Tarenaya hassleriana]|uniref:(R,S)-reticuline 7-O-methyltransferase-like isoform X2 n=1 Tax=Tarenaya hassleriana TaxID=28532 RepID=UPI00053C582B|nr:PREDICTED: (R,S)-reticuline 7-O-methyltransferase-like isoform X2 [Tarenaya hassleriana]
MEEEEARASVDIWRYVFGFTDMAVVKCAIELKIPEAVESHPSQPVTLAELSTAVACSPPLLGRIMRFLSHQGIFKEVITKDGLVGGYLNTPLSRLMMSSNRDDKSKAPLILMESSPVMLAPWLKLSAVVSNAATEEGSQPFEVVHGKDVWAYCAEDPRHSEMFNEAMACDTRRLVPVIAGACSDVFEGVSTVVDVGGGKGDALGVLVKAFPWIKGFNFDLPHVVETALKFDGVENVGGDMFERVPNADAVFIKWVLHDWNDEVCIKLLEKCREAIPRKGGKVVIVDAVVGEKKKGDRLEYARLMLDMVMMAHTTRGRERTLEEWDHVITEAGFARSPPIMIQ